MNKQAKTLWFALVGMAVGATMLHLRIHPPSKGATYTVANIIIFADLLLVSALFLRKKTAVWGLLLNGFIAFLGIILMADFSLTATLIGKIKVPPSESIIGWLMVTTIPDIAIAFADFMVGRALYSSIIGADKLKASGNE